MMEGSTAGTYSTLTHPLYTLCRILKSPKVGSCEPGCTDGSYIFSSITIPVYVGFCNTDSHALAQNPQGCVSAAPFYSEMVCWYTPTAICSWPFPVNKQQSAWLFPGGAAMRPRSH